MCRRFVAVLFGLVSVLGGAGCQFSYPFEIVGVVRAADGTPLAGVRVALADADADRVHESTFPVVTGADGAFKAGFRVASSYFAGETLPKWSLKLSGDGYHPAAVEFGPDRRPESSRTTTVLTADATLSRK